MERFKMGMNDTKEDYTKERAIEILLKHNEIVEEALKELQIQINGISFSLSDYFAKYDDPWKQNEEALTNDEIIKHLQSYAFYVEQLIERMRFDVVSDITIDLMYRISNGNDPCCDQNEDSDP
jgi:hypothetical protein